MRTRISDNAFAALAGTAAVLFATDAILVRRVDSLGLERTRIERSIVTEITRVRSATVTANDARQSEIDALESDLAATKQETVAAADDTPSEVQGYAQRLATRVLRSFRERLQWADSELRGLRLIAFSAAQAANGLDHEIEATRAANAAVRHGNGTAGSAVLHPPAALAALAREDERHRIEIARLRAANLPEILPLELKKSSEPQQVRNVSLQLRSTDRARARYTLRITAGGRSVELKDRTLNEPVRLYLAGARKPVEIVVNEIGKDEVRGTISLPRITEIAQGYSSGRAEMKYFPGR